MILVRRIPGGSQMAAKNFAAYPRQARYQGNRDKMEASIMRGGKQSRIYYKTPGERLRYFKERNASGEIDTWRMLMEIQASQWR